ncbi:hypothetical protein HHI36_014435 [Cryptolaemus montrouzieri]|uniref:F-box domain-containing protein n=1 Tax=Cryptolaemus montrouzieri TaxID=559131 RepID=A0ABD2N301_9CUCU
MENFEQFSTENEEDLHIGYFLRSKRRKLDNDREEVKFCENLLPERQRRKKTPILRLPTEIFRHILKFIPFEQLSNSVRLVNHRFRVVAEDILSTSFKMLERRIKNLLRSTIEALHATHEDMEIKCFCRLINMLEIVNFQAMPTEVKSIVQMTKTFCLHFEKTNEEMVNHSLLISGCKILDLLDSASFAQRDVIFENVKENIFTARYNYFFNNSWFIALNIKSDKEMSWKQKQRMMHMRIRRILLAHTEMFMQQYQYERETMLRKSDNFVKIRKPSNNLYTGYGDIQDKFFFYGVMNDGAYIQKFHPDDSTNEDIDDLIEDDPEDLEVHFNGSEDSRNFNIPHLGVHIDVKISCPVSHAPMRFLEEKLPLDPSDWSVKNSLFEKEKFSLVLKFHCPGAKYPRLPTTYLYKFKHLDDI